jgi:hypothetical protein
MRKNTSQSFRITLNDTTHVRIKRENDNISEIRVIKKINNGLSFVSFSNLEEMKTFIAALQGLEQTL